MSIKPALAAIFARMDADRSVHHAFAHYMFQGVAEMTDTGGWSRGETLRRFKIEDGDHSDVIAAIRAKLELHRDLAKERPGYMLLGNAGKWWLCGALIAEGRLQRATAKVAAQFNSSAGVSMRASQSEAA